MLKIVVSCANGAGSSLMLKMTVEKVMRELGVPCQVTHCPISEGKGLAPRSDYVFTSLAFEKMFDGVKGKAKVIGIRNVMSAAEVKEKYLKSLEPEEA